MLCQVDAAGFEPATPTMSRKPLTVLSIGNNALTSSGKLGCTAGCTSEPKTVNAGANDGRDADPLAGLTAAALKLSKADRQRLLVALAASLGE